jgi:hypothetical protein
LITEFKVIFISSLPTNLFTNLNFQFFSKIQQINFLFYNMCGWFLKFIEIVLIHGVDIQSALGVIDELIIQILHSFYQFEKKSKEFKSILNHHS